jgi:membrane protein
MAVQQEAKAPTAWGLLKTTVIEWNEDNAAHLSAALAYYTIFSFAPLLLIGMALTALVYGPDVAAGRIAAQVTAYTGSVRLAEFFETLIENARNPGANLATTIFGFIALLYGATGLFTELKDALNHIWDVPTKEQQGLWRLILVRLLALVMVVVGGVIMFAALVITTALTAATDWINATWEGAAVRTQVVNFVFFFLLTVVIFALVYKYVPDVRIAWRDIFIGAVATALLFSIGRLLISFYLSQSTIVSVYGAAGSLIVLLLWTYYSAQIFFLGAEFTQVYGRTYGTRQRERPLLEEEPVPEDAEANVMPLPVAQPQPQRRWRRWSRRVSRPVAEIGLALGIIALISVYNLVRDPLRR